MSLGIVEFNQSYRAQTIVLSPIDQLMGRTIYERPDLITKKQSCVVAFQQVAYAERDPKNKRFLPISSYKYELHPDQTELTLADGSKLTVPFSYGIVDKLLAESRKNGTAVDFKNANLPKLSAP